MLTFYRRKRAVNISFFAHADCVSNFRYKTEILVGGSFNNEPDLFCPASERASFMDAFLIAGKSDRN
jgi:hypothetical protein